MTSPGQEPERDVGNLFIFQREFSRQSTMWSSSTHCVRLFACMCVCVLEIELVQLGAVEDR